MAWIRVESSVSRNKKFVKAGPAPSWLWLCGLAYCQEGLTDGFIPAEALPYLGVKNARQLAAHLVSAGLWEVAEGGWRVHDYLQHNKSAAEILGIKQDRRASGSSGGRASGDLRRRRSDHFVANAQQILESAKQVASTGAEANVIDTSKQPSNPSTATATTTATATAQYSRAPLHDTSHRKHAHCGRVCLPAPLFGEFVRRRNHDNADGEIRDWAMEVETAWGDRPDEPGDPYEFWKARYSEKWPTARATVGRNTPKWAVNQ